MRQIKIDLTTDKAFPNAGQFIGYIGEHNATELLISIPQTMVTESDYQVLVLQSGPMVFRSGHITDDKSKTTYREDNIIHTVLSKSVTQVTALALQVECYKEDSNGSTSLIGKTQTTPNLMLKPSPDGFPAYNYGGSYEDIDNAIVNTHSHENREVLDKLAVGEDGNLTYDGKLIEGGGSKIKNYATPSEFPESEKFGTLAYAENDDEEITIEGTSIEASKKYERIRFKFNPDVTSLDFCKDFISRTEEEIANGETLGYFYITRDDNTVVGYFGFMHLDGGLSVLINSNSTYERTKMSYGKDEKLHNADEFMYIYNTVPGMTNENIFGSLDIGWYKVIPKQTNFSIDSDFNYSSDTLGYPEKLTEDDTLFSPYYNVKIVAGQTCTNPELQNEFFSKIFELVPPPVKRKGLYIFTELGWSSLDNYLKSSIKIVNTFADLPDDCPVGTLAHVLHDGGQISAPRESTLYVNNVYSGIYFAPHPTRESFLFDFSVHGKYVEGPYSYYEGEFDIATRFEYNMLSVAVTEDYNSRTMKIYNYSFIDQTLNAEGYTGHLHKGWNKIEFLPDGSLYIKPITNLLEIPCATPNPNVGSGGGYQITRLEVNGEDATKINTFFFATSPFIERDNGAGLWVKTEEGWIKTENPEEFIMKEI